MAVLLFSGERSTNAHQQKIIRMLSWTCILDNLKQMDMSNLRAQVKTSMKPVSRSSSP